MEQHKAYVLLNKNGTFIAAFRFKPKRFYIGKKGDGYYAWTDCNGSRLSPKITEGSMNARCFKVEIQFKLPNKRK